MWTVVLLLFLAVSSPSLAKPKSRLVRYPSWNSRMYPVWKDGDPRYKDSWKGGRVIFNVANDSPTLTGAKVTFTISLEFPHNQKVLPNGDVVWAEDCVLNGTKHAASEPVFPTQDTDWEPVFPDGTPMKKDKKPNYVFVWKAWGQYWQVEDDSSSSLTIATDDVPLGSYTMDIVIYHYRSREKFIPLGYASTQFSITDQIPFAVSLDQVNDIVAGDMRFIQNRAIAFTITLHDPSEYLSDADITFNWEFGDGSGALISRELTVTHTYISTGSFKPKVVVQAVIPDKACDVPVNTTKAPSPPSDIGSNGKAPAVVSAVAKLVSTKATGLIVKLDPSDTEDNSEDEASTTLQESQSRPKTPFVARQGTSGAGAKPPLTGRATLPGVAKRDVGEKPSDEDCVIYRYGSFCTGIEVFEAIEKVEILQMDNDVRASSEMAANVLDITVTCQGSLPKEVCSVILDAECMRPIHTVCNMVEPSKECQLVLRHFFNDSGIYCINVSMANDVSFASTSAKVNFDTGPGLSSPGTIATVLGVLVLIMVIGVVAFSYKRFRSYRALKEDVMISANQQSSRANICSGASTVWNLLNRRGAVDHCPLLQDRPV
ncbi:premelanosome protein b isoform X1 [Takifugu flavidus]|uniref:premelanosome protein b isoform X1 n=1 Tax=Takifugu flavidus TaxID=433684 RepID=UPI002544BDEB|nr:premelanosome protein b isoform X1 [Takifugu flavidus]